MDMQTWLPLVGVVIGYGLAYFGDLRKEIRAAKRERETRRKERQYEAITEAQNQMFKRFRLEGGLAVLCQRHFDETGNWPDVNSRAISYDHSSVIESGAAGMWLVALRSRIEDSELQELLDEFVRCSTTMTAGPDTDTSRKTVERSEFIIHTFNNRARVVLTELH